MKKVTKLIIPLAGFGTRFLPSSKNYPKEMINLVDKPVIHHLVEEAYESGIKEVIFVLNYSKDIISKYFSTVQHPHQREVYDASLVAQENLKHLNDLIRNMSFRYIKKKVTLGDGHSLFLAKHIIEDNEPFAVTMGDLLSPSKNPFIKELITVYQKMNAPVISVEQISPKDTEKFGVIALHSSKGRLHHVKTVVEKPGPKAAPSNLALTGKYILTPEIFHYLKDLLANHKHGEVRLADALKYYSEERDLYAYECSQKIHDTGNKLDFLKATVHFGLNHLTLGKDFKKFIRSLPL